MLAGIFGHQVMMASIMEAIRMANLVNVANRSGPRRKSSGLTRNALRSKYEPHCGERQQARYARQLAAGQIKFIEHGPRK